MFDIDPRRYSIVDLSYEVRPGTDEERPFDAVLGVLSDGCFKYDVSRTHTHVGTHVESPAHYRRDWPDLAAFPLEAFMGRGVLLRIDASLDGLAVGAAYCEAQLARLLREGDCVLCRNESAATLTGAPEDLPHLTPEAARYLAAHRVKLLGIDDRVRLSKGIPEGRELHEALLGTGCILVEFLDNLDRLTRDEFYFMALPWKVRGMDSSWCRAIAVEER